MAVLTDAQWAVLEPLVEVCRPKGKTPPRDARALAVRALKTAGTLATITVLWSLWSSPSVGAWLDLLRKAVP